MSEKEILAEESSNEESVTEEKIESEQSTAGKEKSKQTQNTLKDAWKQVESLGQALGTAMQGRGNAVMVRVNDEALQHLDMLVEAEVTGSRSESAAYLINEGIKANPELFSKIKDITDQIAALRQQLKESVEPLTSEE